MTRDNQPFFQRIFTIFIFILYLNFFFFRSIGSMGFVLIATGFFIFISKILKEKYNKYEFLSTIGLFFSLSAISIGLTQRANTFVTLVLGASVIFIVLLQAYIVSSGIPMIRSLLELLLSPLFLGLDYIKHGFKMLGILIKGNYKELISEEADNKKNTFMRSVLLGLIIGIFVIGILISMLSNADPIFASLIEKIFSTNFLKSLSNRVLLSGMIGVLLSPLLILKRDSIFNSPIQLFKKWNFVHGMSVIMALVSIVLGLFLVIQWPYVFVNVPFETDLSQYGVATYSEYVRKGFIELLRISLFVYILIWAGLIFLREHTKEGKTILPYIQFIVLVEFFIFIASIFRRVWLYQQFHGWTIVRIYGSFVLIWICGITIFLVLRHFLQKRWVIGEVIFTSLVLISIGIFNAEHFIVTHHPPTVNKRVDYVYLSRMSPDGYQGWLESYRFAKNTLENLNSQTTVLSKEQRRDVAYSGYIIKELILNYHNLIRDYGSNAETKPYLLKLIDFHKKAIMTALERNQYEAMANSYQSSLDEINRIESLVKTDAYDSSKLLRGITSYYVTYNFEYKEQKYNTIPSFYSINYYENQSRKDTKKIFNEKTAVDRLTVWNASRKNAYDQMNKAITFEKLLQLQQQYFEMEYRIYQQPANERQYEMDISLDSPLVD